MTKALGDTTHKEKNFLIKKFKTNLFFLILHLPAILKIILYRSHMQLLSFLRPRHRGTKIYPPWLAIPIVQKIYSPDINQLLQTIPHYPLKAFNLPFIPLVHASIEKKDLEAYLAQHRFIDLIEQGLMNNFFLPSAVENWFTHPPAKEDSAWEPYSCSERIANFITWVSWLTPLKRLFLPRNTLFFLHHHVDWLLKHLEFYGKRTNNHILNNARALIMAGAVLRNRSTCEIGMSILKKMLPILIQPQGALREGSTHYQLIVFMWMLDAYRFAEVSGFYNLSELQFLYNILMKMKLVASLFCDEQGYLKAYIGDISPDATPQITCARIKNCYPAFWPVTNMRIHSGVQYDDWHILQKGKNKIILHAKNGQFPYAFTNHAHNDFSSFVWLHADNTILIDSGRSDYTKDKMSIWQKSAAGHNVALINQFAPLCESLIINGHWFPMPYARATVQVNAEEKDLFKIKHNGFKRATPVNNHIREIQFKGMDLQVRDIFTGRGEVNISLIWQFHPSFQLINYKPYTLQNEIIKITLEINATSEIKINSFTVNQIKGQHATYYGEAKEHDVVIIEWHAHLSFESQIRFKVSPCAA